MSTARDVLNQVRHAVSDIYDVFGPLNEAIRVIGKRLYILRSKIIVSDLDIDIVEDDAYGDLPSDFWGLDSKPYLSGYVWSLRPLPSLEVKLSYGSSTGIPRYYEIKGSKIYVTPVSGGSYTIVGDYFAKPTEITADTDTMPYSELFDDIITDYLRVYFAQPAGGAVLGAKNLMEKIDTIALRWGRKTPFHLNCSGMGINWSSM